MSPVLVELSPEELLSWVHSILNARYVKTNPNCQQRAELGRAFGEYLTRSTQFKLRKEEIKALEWGGYFHDIGNIGIPDTVLFKPDKFTNSEWEVIRRHPLIGHLICSQVKALKPVLSIVRSHHERRDGSGYPDGLEGNNIPLEVQCFQFVDIYVSVVSKRFDRGALSSSEALHIIEEEAQRGWRNPELAELFHSFVRKRDASHA